MVNTEKVHASGSCKEIYVQIGGEDVTCESKMQILEQLPYSKGYIEDPKKIIY